MNADSFRDPLRLMRSSEDAFRSHAETYPSKNHFGQVTIPLHTLEVRLTQIEIAK